MSERVSVVLRDPQGYTRVYIHSLRVDPIRDRHVVALADYSSSRYITIYIPKSRAAAIQRALEQPTTQYIRQDIASLGDIPKGWRWRMFSLLRLQITRTEISISEENTLIARVIILNHAFSFLPSLGILLATHEKASMYLAEQVFARLGYEFEDEKTSSQSTHLT